MAALFSHLPIFLTSVIHSPSQVTAQMSLLWEVLWGGRPSVYAGNTLTYIAVLVTITLPLLIGSTG